MALDMIYVAFGLAACFAVSNTYHSAKVRADGRIERGMSRKAAEAMICLIAALTIIGIVS